MLTKSHNDGVHLTGGYGTNCRDTGSSIGHTEHRYAVYMYNTLVVRSNSANAWRASKYMSIGKDDL